MKAFFVLPALCFFVGCSVPSVEPMPLVLGDAPAKSSTDSDPKKPANTGTTPVDTTSSPTTETDDDTSSSSVDTTSTAGTKTPATAARTWTGSLDSSAVVGFGGNGACDYDVVLTNIRVTVAIDANGSPTTGKVTATMTETTSQCQFAPMGTLPLEYDYAAPAGGATGVTFTPLASADNRPQGTLSVTATSTSSSKIATQLVFHRTDTAEDKLNWTITVAVDLTPAAT